MTSYIIRRDVKNWWRHISVRNVGIISKLCILSYHAIAITSVKFCEIWPSRSAFIEIPLFSIRQLPMTSLTSFYDVLCKILSKKLLNAKFQRLILLHVNFHFLTTLRSVIFEGAKRGIVVPPNKSVSLR